MSSNKQIVKVLKKTAIIYDPKDSTHKNQKTELITTNALRLRRKVTVLKGTAIIYNPDDPIHKNQKIEKITISAQRNRAAKQISMLKEKYNGAPSTAPDKNSAENEANFVWLTPYSKTNKGRIRTRNNFNSSLEDDRPKQHSKSNDTSLDILSIFRNLKKEAPGLNILSNPKESDPIPREPSELEKDIFSEWLLPQ